MSRSTLFIFRLYLHKFCHAPFDYTFLPKIMCIIICLSKYYFIAALTICGCIRGEGRGGGGGAGAEDGVCLCVWGGERGFIATFKNAVRHITKRILFLVGTIRCRSHSLFIPIKVDQKQSKSSFQNNNCNHLINANSA